jgi:hypothetical protein
MKSTFGELCLRKRKRKERKSVLSIFGKLSLPEAYSRISENSMP